MRKVKTGIIGIGNMGTAHAINITENHCPEMELTAVADTSPERRAWAKENLPGVCVYGTAEELLDSGRIEAVIIVSRTISTRYTRSRHSSAPFT